MDIAPGYVIMILVIAGLVALAVYNRTGERAERLNLRREHRDLGVPTGFSPASALDSAVMYMTGKGYAVESRSESTVTFTKYLPPNTFTGIVLLLLFILPGILYFILAGRTVRSTVVAIPDEESTRVKLGGEPYEGIEDLQQWQKSLPEPGTIEEERLPELASADDIPGQIRKLAELRDAGIVTEEEFERKKAELLGRM